jgi:uncharacterized protein (TIGR02246 family)
VPSDADPQPSTSFHKGGLTAGEQWDMTFKTRALAVCAIAAVIAGLPSAVSAQNAAVKAAIDANNKKFGAAVAAGNAAGVAGLYTDDAMVLPPNGESVSGRAAIEKLFGTLVAAGIKEITLTATEVEAHGDAATEIGMYSVKDGTGKEIDRGKYMVAWKRVQGQWKLHRDIWNSNLPAAAPAK